MIFLRGVISYIGLTFSFWMMSLAMIYNRAAYPWNPAWRLVVALRDAFTWFGVACTVVMVAALIFEKIIFTSTDDNNDQPLKPRELTPEEIKDREARREQQIARELLEKQKRIEAEKLQKEQTEKELAERKKQERLRRKNRTARDAAREALDDF